MKKEDKELYLASIKSVDTEEFLDMWFYRPLGFSCALFFRNRGVHPNVITILSIFLGIGAGVCFMSDELRWNMLGILLLMWANLYDSTDGQLARMTGQKTRWGRILDGFAGDCWFFCIYFAIAARETFEPIPFAPEYNWGVLIWILVSYSGFWIHGSQCQLADYYRNVHLYFTNEKNGNEFHNSIAQKKEFDETPWKGNFFWKVFLNAYVQYVTNQERMSPMFQNFIKTIYSHYGTNIPRGLREEFRKGSLPLMKYTNFITFNSRAIMLCFTMLIGELWLYLAFELVVLMAAFLYMQYKHESLCRRLTKKIEDGYEFN
ncbi:MAG: CDP-alcohol phosphatidyltransferase family protein [Bacteroidaceae bacterium]|nr:CDP-alcohol phosphatidyltransferase family protein [Bacteroidaceae bacterium]